MLTRPRRAAAQVLQLFLALTMVVAFAWDADGNPNTENLPQVVLTVADDTVDHVAGIHQDSPSSIPPARPGRIRRLRSVWHTWRLASWRATAPERGP